MSVSAPLTAQRLGPAVARPRLRDSADTNDAHAYYNLGLSLFEGDPEEAAAAFYWATRIDPSWGEPLYARRAALIMTDQGLLIGSTEGDRRTLESPKMRRLDSLEFRALMRNPFLNRRLDRQLLMTYFRGVIRQNARLRGGNDQPSVEVDYVIERYLSTAGERMRAWLAYGSGDLPNALDHYANALASTKDKAGIRLERARIFATQGQVQSAITEFGIALDEMRKLEQKDLIVFYNSKAVAEYSVAVLHEGAGNVAGARDAYARALQEDLAFYPAHMRLGLLALGLRDTATALNELALATQIAPNEPHVRYVYGYALVGAGRFAEAVGELKAAVTLEPYYARPYIWLGMSMERLEKAPEALDAYQKYLAFAMTTDPQRPLATERRDQLKEIVSFTVPKP
jgi:tetratricopeptide (TPR) repeat protein